MNEGMKENVRNWRWWVAVGPVVLIAAVGIPAELIANKALAGLDALHDWVFQED